MVLAVGTAYWLSLATVVSGLAYQTPAAFAGLAPMLALGLFAVAYVRKADAIRAAGRFDWALATLFVGLAGAIVFAGPSALSIYFWSARLDLLSMPMFAAGVVVLVMGWRFLVHAIPSLVVLALVWPLPYNVVSELTLPVLTTATVIVIGFTTSFIPVARPLAAGSDIFVVGTGPESFPVIVATVCAGMNSALAFLLLALPTQTVTAGRLRSRTAWILTGLVLTWAFNALRIMLLLVVGAWQGREAALNLVHAVAGLIAIGVATGIMVFLMPQFGLRVRPILAAPRNPLRRVRRRVVSVVAITAILFGFVNHGFSSYAVAANGGVTPVQPMGVISGTQSWDFTSEREIVWATPYFGEGSTWKRVRARPAETVAPSDRFTVWVDSITTGDYRALTEFGVEDCYNLHGLPLVGSQTAYLGSGVVATVGAYEMPEGGYWHLLWWEWPVDADGIAVHERVVLLASSQSTPNWTQPSLEAPSFVAMQAATALPSPALAEGLIVFGAEIVAARTSAS